MGMLLSNFSCYWAKLFDRIILGINDCSVVRSQITAGNLEHWSLLSNAYNERCRRSLTNFDKIWRPREPKLGFCWSSSKSISSFNLLSLWKLTENIWLQSYPSALHQSISLSSCELSLLHSLQKKNKKLGASYTITYPQYLPLFNSHPHHTQSSHSLWNMKYTIWKIQYKTQKTAYMIMIIS